jgi:hypothetical protein
VGVDGAIIFIEVTSIEAQKTYAYRIDCSVEMPEDAKLTSVTVGGATATLAEPMKLSAPGGDFTSSFTGAYGSVNLTAAQAGDGSTVAVVATGLPGATIRYAWGVTANFAGVATYFSEWQEGGTGLFDGGDPNGLGFLTAEPGVDGAVILIEVTSSTGLKAVYAINCTVGEPGRDFTASLANNEQYGDGHQFVTSTYYEWILPGGPITTGDVYVITFDVVSNFAFEELDVFFVDPSPPSYWRELTDNGQGGPIGTTTPTHISCTLTAKDSGGNTATTNSFGFRTDESTNGRTEPVVLTITNFRIAKQ